MLNREQLSLHIRGPTWVKQLAVYVPTVSHPKHGNTAGFHGRRHGHQHLHQQVRDLRAPEAVRRAVGDVVSAEIDGFEVSWTNVYAGPDATTSVPAPIAAVPEMEHGTPLASANAISTEIQAPLYSPNLSIGTQTQTPQASPCPSIDIKTQILQPSLNTGISTETKILQSSPTSGTVAAEGSNNEGGSWTRQAYYNAAGGVSHGFTFLNHFGGSSGIPGTADGGDA